KALEGACQDLVRAGGKEAIAPILALLAKAEGATYWPLVNAAAAFQDEGALDELGKFLIAHQGEPKSCAADVVFVLGANGAGSASKLLALLLEKGRLDLQLMAADALAALRTPEALAALDAALGREKKESELHRRI